MQFSALDCRGQTAWLGGRILSGLLVVIPIVAALGIVAATYGQVDLNVRSWAQLTITLIIGAVPIAPLVDVIAHPSELVDA